MKIILMSGVSGLCVLMISVMLLLSVRDDMRQDPLEAAVHDAPVQVAHS